MITGKWIASGNLFGVAWYLCWGRIGIWQKDQWAFEVHYPYIRWKKYASEILLTADTTLRINWREKAFAIQLLGFAVAFTLTPAGIKHYRNTGQCYHGVPLYRVCAECKSESKESS